MKLDVAISASANPIASVTISSILTVRGVASNLRRADLFF